MEKTYMYVHVPVTAAAMRILLVIMYIYIIGVEAQVTVIPPYDATITLGQIATFSCAASNVASITFVVAGVGTSTWASRGINQSAPTFAGGYTTADLKVQGTIDNNGLQISGRVYLVSGAYLDIPPPAQLNVQAPPSAPLNLKVANVTDTYVVLTWSPPMDLGIGGPLYYNVSYQAVNGRKASNVTSINTAYTNITVTNLYPGVTYIMTVEADNGVPEDESKRSATIYVTTLPTYTYTPTQTDPTVPSSAPSNALPVGVYLAVMVVVMVVVGVVGLLISILYMYQLKKKKSATIPLPATSTHMPSGDGVVVGMLTPSSQEEGSESKPSSDVHVDVDSETCIKNKYIGAMRSTIVPTSEGNDDMRMMLLPLCTEAADVEDSTTPQCRHGPPTAPPLQTCILMAPEDGEVPTGGGYIAIEMEHGDTSQHEPSAGRLESTSTCNSVCLLPLPSLSSPSHAKGIKHGVKAITAEIYPKEINIQYNKSASVYCADSNVAAIDPSMWASHWISQSAPTYSGSDTTVNIIVEGIIPNNGLQIKCRVYETAATYVDFSPPAVLRIEGVKAITVDIYPKEKIIPYNQRATFSCSASKVVNTRGISQSAETYSESNTTTTLTVQGIKANNGLHITCRVYLGTAYQDILPPAVLTIEDPTTSTSSSSQVSPTITPSPTCTTSTPVPSLMMSTSAVGIDVVVGVVAGAGALMALVALSSVVAIKICRRSKNSPSTSRITPFTTNGIPLSPAGKGEEKGTSDTVIQVELWLYTLYMYSIAHCCILSQVYTTCVEHLLSTPDIDMNINGEDGYSPLHLTATEELCNISFPLLALM